ncbi:MAG: 50S ribosomal protein L19 [Proteobacteria bacterium]|nr:50S ribosomal protein L19 [Pseudomonadota bacterium]
MDIIARLNQETIGKAAKLPAFAVGDTLKVFVRVTEGDKTRLQAFEGLCIAKHNDSIGSSFTVRKMSFGEGVERVFPLFSPVIDHVDVLRKGDVRRGKLYYLRGLTGKAARISEKARVFGLAANEGDVASAADMPEEAAAPVEMPAAEAQPSA